MNPDYKPRYKRERGAPYDNEHFDIQDVNYMAQHEYEAQVGRVILQEGLVGALVLSYEPDDKTKTPFKIKLADGSIAEAGYKKSYIWIDTPECPAGIAEDGWYVPELGVVPENEKRWESDGSDLPF